MLPRPPPELRVEAWHPVRKLEGPKLEVKGFNKLRMDLWFWRW